jgi:uncharacterized protein
MGVDFFREVALRSEVLRGDGKKVSNGIQTNGTLVTEELLDFIEGEKDFRLGFSLDGPRCVNDKTRIYAGGRGAFKDIFSGIKMAYGRGRSVGGGAIAVVNKENLPHLEMIYDFFNQEGIFLKLNPIIDIADREMGISSVEYAMAMNSLFDKWFQDYDAIEVDPFSQIIGNFMSGRPSGCNYSKSCQESFVSIGPRGDIYPCGRFDGLSDYRMGNINDADGLSSALNSGVRKALLKRASSGLEECQECEYVPVCNGGCPHNALIWGDINGKDPYCGAYKVMFGHIKREVHKELKKAEVKGGKK